MPKVVYNNIPNKKFELLPDGDYLLEIIAGEPGLSTANKYRGAEQFELTFRDVETGSTFTDWVTFHPDLNWKVDNFLTCFNYPAQVGQEVEVTLEECIGLRGWCLVSHYEKNGKKYNQIKVYYTDKAKVERASAPEPAPAATVAANTDPFETA